jgi:hypothetical protein
MKNKKKTIIKIIITIVILVVFFYLGGIIYSVEFESIYYNGFYKEELYKSPDGKSYILKSYYYEEPKSLNKKYKLGNKKIEEVEKNIKLTIEKLNELNENIIINFDYNKITSDDYYLMINNKNPIYFQYYDKEEHIFYEVCLNE